MRFETGVMVNRRTISRRGFTLLELVLVMLIIAIALGSVAPSMNGFAEGRKVNEAAEHFASTAHWARQQALTDAATYQINMDPASRTWQAVVVTGDQQSPAAGEMGKIFTADETVEISAVGLGGKALTAIVFEPNGRSDIGEVTFTGRRGKVMKVVCETSLDEYRLMEGE